MLTDRANTICLYKILEQFSDERHVLTMKDIISHFQNDYDLKVDRRTIYSSLSTLKELGYDVSCYDENGEGYYLRTRVLEAAEVHLISDAIFSLFSIPHKQSAELVRKLHSMLSIYCRPNYRNLVSISTSRKTENTMVFENIAMLDDAINQKLKVSFIYLQYGLDKKLHPRRKERYIVNPYGMVCENSNYYLVCVKEGKTDISYYRIDLMKGLRITTDKVELKPSKLDLLTSKKIVYAFSGKQQDIVLLCNNSVIGGLIDRFGTELKIKPVDEERFQAHIRAVPQGVLYWTMQYLSEVEIIAPESMRQAAIDMLKSNKYGV